MLPSRAASLSEGTTFRVTLEEIIDGVCPICLMKSAEMSALPV